MKEIDIEKIASLAKIDIKGEEKKQMEIHFRKMLEYFQKLQELDLEGVEPLINPHEGTQRMRKDEPGKGLNREDVFKSAPDVRDNYFRVVSPLKDVRKEQ